jgi:hypothetical protein
MACSSNAPRSEKEKVHLKMGKWEGKMGKADFPIKKNKRKTCNLVYKSDK